MQTETQVAETVQGEENSCAMSIVCAEEAEQPACNKE